MHTTSVYTLTERDRDILSNQNDEDIIATGPWAKGPMSLPHRLVIREQPDKFIVHLQIIGESAAFFEHGDYCLKAHASALSNAWEHFTRRVRDYHNLHQPQRV